MASSHPAALIVGAQPFVGMVTSDILKELGFETFHAYDALAAAQLLDEHPEIDLMVTEVELPAGVNGLELCRRISTERPRVQLVVTGTMSELRHNEVPHRASILRKPFASGELRMLVADRRLLAPA